MSALKEIWYRNKSFKAIQRPTTVKLGYNELGYNEHSVITNKMFSPKWPFYYTKQPGYNEPRL